MTDDGIWIDLGPVDALKNPPVREVRVGRARIALTWNGERFGAVSGVCNHVGGPLGQGTLDGDYLVCPWHYWKFHHATGEGEPGFEDDRVPSHPLREENGRLWVRSEPATSRNKKPHAPHPLARPVERRSGAIRVLGISTTVMDPRHPRFSTSEVLLDEALRYARESLEAETQSVRLRDLSFRACEGFYSKGAQACTWPCSITQMDPDDRLDRVYEGIVHWADVILVATPIRWGAASSLYYKMVERMNCVQNQITIRDKVLIQDKVAAFLITGGQDNVQAVAGHLLGFFSEIGCHFPPFPYVAHSRGWTAEDMERNVEIVANSEELREGTRALVDRAVALARDLRSAHRDEEHVPRGGRKAHRLIGEG